MHKHGFFREHQFAFSFLYRLVDLGILSAMLLLSTWICEIQFSYLHTTLGLSAILSFLYFSDLFGLYRSWRGNNYREIFLVLAGVVFGTFVVIALLGFLTKNTDILSRKMVFYWGGMFFAISAFWRYSLHLFLKELRKHGRNRRTFAIVGGTEAGVKLREYVNRHPELGMEFRGFFDDRRGHRLPCSRAGSFDDAIDLAREGRIDQIYIALSLRAEERINEIIMKCGDTTCDVYMVPDLLTFNLINARVQNIGEQVSLSVFESPYLGRFRPLKRTIDIVFSLGILTGIAIPMLVIAALIKITDPNGPIFFKQKRYGLSGKPIEVLKFRSMTTTDNGPVVQQATRDDPRVTRLGRILRKHSLDELPQFINVLKGDMSIVGPRPHAVAHNEEYRKKVDYYMLRHKVKPGITGWAQINGWRGETDTLDKMQRRIDHDLEYIRRWSPWLDIKIIFLTIFKGFNDDNVY
jgi:putative colanic acid biosynthesis UDP-glucose lipid carrier transferase